MPVPCSPRSEIKGLVYFPRMLDKIRLKKKGELPEEYHNNLGKAMDADCCDFLHIDYSALSQQVQTGASDEELLAWAKAEGRSPNPSEIRMWSEYLSKRGWRDELAAALTRRKGENNFEDRAEIETFFDYIDADEGRAVESLETKNAREQSS